MGPIALVLALIVIYDVFTRWSALRRVLESIKHHPGTRRLTSTYGAMGYFFPWRIPGLTAGSNYHFVQKYEDFKRAGFDIVADISLLPISVVFAVADPGALKEMSAARSRFPKPVEVYGTLSLYGPNIVASEHEEWKRYRRICAPSFSEKNNRLVWQETVRIVTELFDEVWGQRKEIVVDDTLEVTLSITLFIISIAGFGQRISWRDDSSRPAGYEMTFKEVIHHMSTGVFVKILTPGWLLKLGLTEKMRNTNVAFKELGMYMSDMIKERRESEKKEERYDLFSSLLDASEAEGDGELKLTDTELMGNIFIFLIAGHETTGHTLCYSLALLALYPDEQEKLYQHVKTLLPDGQLPRYEDVNNYTYANAVLYETLRMFPSVIGIPKRAADDSVMKTTNAAGEQANVFIPKGSEILFSTPGLHYNPRYWDDPHTFNPSRFLGDWPRDAYLPFSGGPRACLGRRFAEIEAVGVLVLFVSRYTVAVKDEPQFAAESLAQRKERVLRSQAGLTLTPKHVPLVFKRRY